MPRRPFAAAHRLRPSIVVASVALAASALLFAACLPCSTDDTCWESSTSSLDGGCEPVFAPVCGSDGRSYANACEAGLAGVTPEADGLCADPAERACSEAAHCLEDEVCAQGVCAPSPSESPCEPSACEGGARCEPREVLFGLEDGESDGGVSAWVALCFPADGA